MTPHASVIVEWQNVKLAGAPRARAMLQRLGHELRAAPRPVEVIIAHDGQPPEAADLTACGVPDGWHEVAAPGAGYYELRNCGVAESRGDVVVFLDSDVIPEPGWLGAMLAPFENPAVEVVAGHAYIDPENLWARAFALTWFFPLRAEPGPLAPTAHFFANTVAFRRATFLAHPFRPRPHTSRGACLALAEDLERAGITIWKTTAAQVSHPAPRGGRHVVLRALAQGRDRVARSRGWRATPLGTAARLAARCGSGFIRIFRGRRAVGLSLPAVPAAWVVCVGYYTLCAAGELAAIVRLPAIRRVQV